MKVGLVTLGTETQQKPLTAADALTRDRQEAQSGASSSAAEKSKVPQEEIISKVKALLDGSYSIRFERDQSTQSVVIRLVDTQTGEAIRQIPPEEFLQLAQILEKQKGQLLRATS